MSPSDRPPVPPSRLRVLRDAPTGREGRYVLYWMTAARRTRHNWGLQRAADLAAELGRPLVILEALRVGYRWASDRLHRFIIEGMRDNRAALEAGSATYYAYVEPEEGVGSGLVEALAADACVVVADDYPAFFLPRMLAGAARRVPVRFEAVDSNGLLPMHTAGQLHASAYQFRRTLQRLLPAHLSARPAADPLKGVTLPTLAPDALADVERRWPHADLDSVNLAALPIDHAVPPSPIPGGASAGRERLAAFISASLERYGQGRNHPDDEDQSGLSPYLHFGHLGAHEVFAAVVEREGWTPEHLGEGARGHKAGWWGMSPGAESFLDELVTWRELGFNACVHDPDGYDRYESIPEWAQRTLEAHAGDARHTYTLDQIDTARTHDEVWNAAQRQLRSEGRIHNYLRMLWGKRILEWTDGPRVALAVMVELNNRYALDGRDPNSYCGILWCLGKYDRPWGPERPIFGTVRYMSSENTRRKLRLSAYLERWGPGSEGRQAGLGL
ncbi:MAG: deoxyribodipyrimidine photolyase [Dehalococcoidia bacterium]